MQRIHTQVLRFGCIGILNTVIDFLVFNVLILWTGVQGGLLLAVINLVATGVAMLNSFLLNHFWVFKKDRNPMGRFLPFLISTLWGVILNNGVILMGLRYRTWLPLPTIILINVLKIMGALLSGTSNFLLYKFWVFKVAEPLPKATEVWTPGLVSVILPAYNEANRLPMRLKNLATTLPQLFPVEIVVVNDGSKDHTQASIEAIARDCPHVRLLHHKKNRGKGAAVRTGMLAASGEYLIFTDADDTYTVDHISMMARQLQHGAEVVIGVREGEQGKRLDGESRHRQWMGIIFNRVIQFLLLPGLTDTQCGLKGFHRHVADQIFPHQKLNRFAFDVELLALARAMKFSIIQIPVRASVTNDSRVNPILSPLTMGVEVLKLKGHLFFNSYKLPGVSTPAHEVAIAGAFFFTALGVRIPWLWEIPRFIDELKEVNLAYLIYTDKTLPLHNMAKDIGAMHNYILAGIFKLFGPNILWPRLYVMITGALTVVLVYMLGKKLYNKTTGLVAAALLLTNGLHILISHMAWSNCTTPFFFTLALFATVVSEEKCSGKWLIIASILWAATLQTHSSAIVYVTTVAVYLFRPSLRNRIPSQWYKYATLTFIIGYSNMIIFNIISKGGSIRWVVNKPYALENNPGFLSYLINSRNMFIELIRTISATYIDHVTLREYLLQPLFTITIILLIYGSYRAIRLGKTLLLWILIGSFLMIPWVNSNYWFFLYTRYIMPVVICSLILVAYGTVQLYEQLSSLCVSRKVTACLAVGCLLLFICGQYIPYWRYCTQLSGTNYSNRMTLHVYYTINNILKNNKSLILIDNNLDIENDPLPYLFTLENQDYVKLPTPDRKNAEILLESWGNTLKKFPNQRLIAVLDGKTYSAIKELTSLANQVNHFTCQVLTPRSSKIGLREVYLVELIPSP